MSSSHKNLSDYSHQSAELNGAGFRFAIVVAEWNKDITEALCEGAQSTLLAHGAKAENIQSFRVAGTYELPQLAAYLLEESRKSEEFYQKNPTMLPTHLRQRDEELQRRDALRQQLASSNVDAETADKIAPPFSKLPFLHIYDAVICLGCVIKGETSHNEYINHSVANALQTLSMRYFKPCIFGVLTPNTLEQAQDRAGGKHGNKGTEAAAAALQMLAAMGAGT